ncbi:aryl-sulfate sulfotransferase [Marine Group I thaumarchaeote]|uniref:Aryl-sulfate sulfotransferase n=1 Tax=Marine Group I thaumarchaeote TaxID=2511932 RepID=A0A7K4MR82_9ARCH|nr:aryl-sulfate sulfotransferase [Marine Group I thaumarchaeote]
MSLINIDSEEEYEVETQYNSNLVLDFIQWNSTFSWDVTAINENGEYYYTSENRTFSINPLPDYFPSTDNLFIDETLYQDGVTVMDIESLNFSGGVNRFGIPIWFVDKNLFDIRFTFTHFLPNGNVIGFEPDKGYEIDLNGNRIFETPDGYSLHHDFIKTSRNTYFLISATIENQYCPEECNEMLPDEIPWQGDTFREFDQDGNEIWSWNTFDYFDSTEYNPYYVQTYNGNYEMDWTHSNSVFFDENTESVFVSVRNLSWITKIDYASKDIIWNMGNTDYMNEIYFEEDLNFSQQHSVQVLDNGNLLFFDNHRYLTPELSRCMEISYDESDYSVEIVWEHQLPENMFSGSRGECDRLENGNTLITAGRSGHILEVTPDHEIAWQLEFDNGEVYTSSYRSERIPNLHPIAYSFTLTNFTGSIEYSYVDPENDILEATIHNNSWGTGWYIYTLLYNDVEIVSDNIFINPFENSTFNIDLNTLDINSGSILTLEIYPENAPEKFQSVDFSIYSSVLLGDLNNDGTLNILDIVILANLILAEDSSNPAGDLNNDGLQNILDIVLLINIILDGF